MLSIWTSVIFFSLLFQTIAHGMLFTVFPCMCDSVFFLSLYHFILWVWFEYVYCSFQRICRWMLMLKEIQTKSFPCLNFWDEQEFVCSINTITEYTYHIFYLSLSFVLLHGSHYCSGSYVHLEWVWVWVWRWQYVVSYDRANKLHPVWNEKSLQFYQFPEMKWICNANVISTSMLFFPWFIFIFFVHIVLLFRTDLPSFQKHHFDFVVFWQ